MARRNTRADKRHVRILASTRLIVTLWLAVIADAPVLAQEQVDSRPPDLPYFQWNACPFEGCAYGKWTAESRVPLFSSWAKSRRRVGELAKGNTVVAITGVVITYRPGVIEVDRDPWREQDIKRGD